MTREEMIDGLVRAAIWEVYGSPDSKWGDGRSWVRTTNRPHLEPFFLNIVADFVAPYVQTAWKALHLPREPNGRFRKKK